MRRKILIFILLFLCFIYFFQNDIEYYNKKYSKYCYERDMYWEGITNKHSLIDAFMSVDKTKALFLAQNKLNLNEISTVKGFEGLTPLMLACYASQFYLVKALIENGANINQKTKDGMNALHIGLLRGVDFKPEILTYLIDHGANIYEKDNYGKTPLINAVIGQFPQAFDQEYEELFKILLKYTTKIDEPDNKGINALGYSIIYNKTEFYNFLLKHGCDLKFKNYKNETLLHFAAQSRLNDDQIIQNLINTIGVDVVNDSKTTPLHYAAQNRSIEVIKKLIKNNANCNIQDSIGNIPLHYAIEAIYNNKLLYLRHYTLFDDLELITVLLIGGSKLYIKNITNETPLSLFINHQKRIIRFFWGALANIISHNIDRLIFLDL